MKAELLHPPACKSVERSPPLETIACAPPLRNAWRPYLFACGTSRASSAMRSQDTALVEISSLKTEEPEVLYFRSHGYNMWVGHKGEGIQEEELPPEQEHSRIMVSPCVQFLREERRITSLPLDEPMIPSRPTGIWRSRISGASSAKTRREASLAALRRKTKDNMQKNLSSCQLSEGILAMRHSISRDTARRGPLCTIASLSRPARALVTPGLSDQSVGNEKNSHAAFK